MFKVVSQFIDRLADKGPDHNVDYIYIHTTTFGLKFIRFSSLQIWRERERVLNREVGHMWPSMPSSLAAGF